MYWGGTGAQCCIAPLVFWMTTGSLREKETVASIYRAAGVAFVRRYWGEPRSLQTLYSFAKWDWIRYLCCAHPSHVRYRLDNPSGIVSVFRSRHGAQFMTPRLLQQDHRVMKSPAALWLLPVLPPQINNLQLTLALAASSLMSHHTSNFRRHQWTFHCTTYSVRTSVGYVSRPAQTISILYYVYEFLSWMVWMRCRLVARIRQGYRSTPLL